MTLDQLQKWVQIAFWSVSGIVLVLSYLRARRSLLSTVNTEYQKRVMDRLQNLSEQLYEEFDMESEEHWSKKDSIKKGIKEINDTFERNKEEVLSLKYWPFGIPHTPDARRLEKILAPLESDPFIPENIRELVVDLVKNRLDVIRGLSIDVFEKYTKDLAKGKKEPVTDLDGLNEIHNRVNSQLNERGCGISQIQGELHEIRKAIQAYFESFAPR